MSEERTAWVSKLLAPKNIKLNSIKDQRINFTRVKQRQSLGSMEPEIYNETAFIELPDDGKLVPEESYPINWQNRVAGNARFMGYKCDKPVWEIDITNIRSRGC